MAGCWRGGSEGGAVIDEYYTPPSENLILGVSRYTKGGRVTSYEFATIAAQGDSDLVLTPRPVGQSPADFNLAKLQPGVGGLEQPAARLPAADQLPQAGLRFVGRANRGPRARREPVVGVEDGKGALREVIRSFSGHR